MAVKHVEANGLRFAYLEEGTGPLVLLFHGFPDTARTWDHVQPQIAAKGYRVVAPFMRGYAPTAIPERDADQETLGRDVLALIAALGETKAIVVGHDWGASAVYTAAALEPARIEKLFVVAIPHPATVRITPSLMWGVRHFLAYKLPGASARFAEDDFAALSAIYRRWSPTWTPAPAEHAAVRECFSDPSSLAAAFGYYRKLSFLMPDYLKKPIMVPTVAFAGLDDPQVTPDDYRHASKMFGAGYAVEEIRGGHFLHREYPAEFAARLLSHL
jgi:pimeloyl-ACP methyl ester carboxylesterase